MSEKSDIIILDFHAEATSEKKAMGFMLDGKVNLVFGTHTHVQTADDVILPKGTAYITDIGMTGPKDSIIGADKVKISILPAKTTLSAMLFNPKSSINVVENSIKYDIATIFNMILSIEPSIPEILVIFWNIFKKSCTYSIVKNSKTIPQQTVKGITRSEFTDFKYTISIAEITPTATILNISISKG